MSEENEKKLAAIEAAIRYAIQQMERTGFHADDDIPGLVDRLNDVLEDLKCLNIN